jgi:transposase
VRRTYAPRGCTPVLRHTARRKSASMIAMIGYHPDRERTRLCFELREGTYDTSALIEALTRLGHHYAGENVVLIWDGHKAHHSRAMRAWAATQPWLTLEKLPAYAPELNPVERLWSSLKTCELANRATTTLTQAADAAQAGIHRITTQPELPWSYLTHTHLTLTPQTPQNF